MIFFGKTDIGRKRDSNQDSFSICKVASGEIVGVLCDGMGGANGGNIASAAAVEAFMDYIETALTAYVSIAAASNSAADEKPSRRRTGVNYNYTSLLQSAVDAANNSVYARAQHDISLEGMGTTLVCVLISNEKLYIANVGDSRLYLLHENQVKQITHDHSYVQYLVDMGRISEAEAQQSPYKNIITRAIGLEPSVEADTFTVPMSENGSDSKNPDKKLSGSSYILMCSDGLTNFLSTERISEIIYGNNELAENNNCSSGSEENTDDADKNDKPETSDSQDAEKDNTDDLISSGITGSPDDETENDMTALKEKVTRMIDEANEAGGADNITAVLIKI